jgi:hypothetical protein
MFSSGTGFQGGLLWYRSANDVECITQLAGYAGRKITVPSCFMAEEAIGAPIG